MKWNPPEFVAAKLLASYAGWDVSRGMHATGYNEYYIATHLRTGEIFKVEATIPGAAKLVELVQRKNAQL